MSTASSPIAAWRPPRDPATVERIEVLKGPAGAIFGDIDPGGRVNIVSKVPDFAPARPCDHNLWIVRYPSRRSRRDRPLVRHIGRADRRGGGG